MILAEANSNEQNANEQESFSRTERALLPKIKELI